MRISYSKIDTATQSITALKDDGLNEMIQALKDEFSYSQSDYVDKLSEIADDLGDIRNVLDSLLSSTKSMLSVARGIYEDSDTDMSGQMGEEG